MADLSNPSPLVMTHFELIATLASVFAVIVAVALDFKRSRSSKPALGRES